MEYRRALDGMRGVAILLVACFHYAQTPWSGWAGVQMFFVLSGFLITQILLRDRNLPLATYLKNFYVRRALRIFPLYFTVLAIFLVLSLSIDYPPQFGRYAPFLFTYSYNFLRGDPTYFFSRAYTHFWSLCVEEQFYLLWPLTVYLLPKGAFRALLILLLVLAPASRALSHHLLALRLDNVFARGDAVYWLPTSHLDAFAVGAAVAAWRLETRVGRPLPLLLALFLLTGAGGLVNNVLIERMGRSFPFGSFGYPAALPFNGQWIWGYSLLNALFGALLLCLLHRSNPLCVFEQPWLVETGRVSYGLYVFHMAFFERYHALCQWLVPEERLGALPRTAQLAFGLVKFALALLLVRLLAQLSHRHFEAFFLQLKQRFSPVPAPAPAPALG